MDRYHEKRQRQGLDWIEKTRVAPHRAHHDHIKERQFKKGMDWFKIKPANERVKAIYGDGLAYLSYNGSIKNGDGLDKQCWRW